MLEFRGCPKHAKKRFPWEEDRIVASLGILHLAAAQDLPKYLGLNSKYAYIFPMIGGYFQWRIQAKRLEGQSNKGAPKSLHLFISFSAKIVGYNTKVASFCRPRKWLFLVELCDFSGNHQSLKSLFVINSQIIWSGSKKIGITFHKIRVTENPMGVPNNILYLQ